MRGLQYYSDDDFIALHLLKAHRVAQTVEYVRAQARQQHRYAADNFRDVERIGKRLEDYGEELALRRYGLRHYNLAGIKPHLEAARIGVDGVIAFIHERTMQIMPGSLSPEQRRERLHDLMFPDQSVRR